MSKQELLDQLRDDIVNFNIEQVQQHCRDALNTGILPYDIIRDGMARGMDIVSKKYEEKEYFLTELVMAGETMKQGMEVIEPILKGKRMKVVGRVVIGTVKGDLHDIGKNILITLLKAAGFEVFDLGVDVPPGDFIEAIKKNKAHIVAMSALLSTSMPFMGETIKKLREAGIRDEVKVIIGGNPIHDKFSKEVGADAWSTDAVLGVELAKKLMSEH